MFLQKMDWLSIGAQGKPVAIMSNEDYVWLIPLGHLLATFFDDLLDFDVLFECIIIYKAQNNNYLYLIGNN